MNGWQHTDEFSAMLAKDVGDTSTEERTSPFLDLATHVSEYIGPTSAVMRQRFDSVINWPLYRSDDTTPHTLLSHAIRRVARLRLDLAKYARPDVRAKNYAKAALEMALAGALAVKGRAEKIPRPFHFFERTLDGATSGPYWVAVDAVPPLTSSPVQPKTMMTDEAAPSTGMLESSGRSPRRKHSPPARTRDE
jgi:hypothetical protein